MHRSVEDDFAGIQSASVARRTMAGIIPDHLRRRLLKPLEVAGRLTAGAYDGVVLVDGCDRRAVAIVRRRVLRRVEQIRERNFQLPNVAQSCLPISFQPLL
jgi:hypothetical protein